MAVLATSYVDMYRVRSCIQSGQAVSTLSQYFDYKGKEFKLKNAERDSANLSMSVLKDSLQLLLDTDVALKSSRTDNRIIMEQLLAKLLMVSGKGE